MAFPQQRPRRLRRSEPIRRLVREHELSVNDLIQPLFVVPGTGVRDEIASLPGQFHLSVDRAVEEASKLAGLGVPGLILFGLPEQKDERASQACSEDAPVQRACAAIADAGLDVLVIADTCLCEYTSHGHCGIVNDRGEVDNDATLAVLAKTAVSQARAGADIVAPSDMMDGRVRAIRAALDEACLPEIPILSYAAKFASAFYGPFRDAAGSAPEFGDRRGYQMDPANGDEAVREVALDIEEGADMVIIKPGLPYLDLVRRVKDAFEYPTGVYHVSGEYAMLEAAAARGWLDRRRAVEESLLACKRAGADFILTYYAGEVAGWLAGR